MEIEKKYLITKAPDDLEQYKKLEIEQGYLSVAPVVRIRRIGSDYVLTYKSKKGVEKVDGVCVNQEVELPLTKESFEHMREKIDGNLITKTRYCIAYANRTIELDVFHGIYEGMVLAEVEFPSVEEAESFVKPDWFGENVSGNRCYTNAYLALQKGNKE